MDNTRSTKTDEQTLVHCNLGWRGAANGYYASGILAKRQNLITVGFHLITYNNLN